MYVLARPFSLLPLAALLSSHDENTCHRILSPCTPTCHSSTRSIKSEDAEAIAVGCAIPVQAAPTLLSSPTCDVTCVG